MLSLELPWPDKRLSPNYRGHWATVAKAKSIARKYAAVEARRAGLHRLRAKALDVTVTFMPPDNRRRDMDNAIASMKAALDGIADTTGVDDSNWQIGICKVAPRKPGAVRIEIREIVRA